MKIEKLLLKRDYIETTNYANNTCLKISRIYKNVVFVLDRNVFIERLHVKIGVRS